MQTHPLVHYRFVLLLLRCSVLTSLCTFVGCVEEMPETPLPSHHFDLSRFSENIEFLKTKFRKVDHDYWTIDDNGIWQLTTETDEVTFPSHFATLNVNDGRIFHSQVFLSSVGMSHQDARTLALRLGTMVHATPEQLAKLEAWPEVPRGSLANVVDINVRTDDRSLVITIREGFDPRLPARVLFDMYDTTDAQYGRKEPAK